MIGSYNTHSMMESDRTEGANQNNISKSSITSNNRMKSFDLSRELEEQKSQHEHEALVKQRTSKP